MSPKYGNFIMFKLLRGNKLVTNLSKLTLFDLRLKKIAFNYSERYKFFLKKKIKLS